MRHEAAAQAGASTREAVLAELGRSLIDELEDVIARKDVRSRAAVMRRVTDLFMMNGAGFSQEHVAMFDEVMSRLIAAIDGLARVTFGDQFARMPHAPPRTLRMLALDDAIEVAGPVLTRSQGISDDTLVETASTKSQAHLHAIAQRPTISAPVTDVLVDRGDQQVVRATAANPGARFSERGCAQLALRSRDDGELARSVLARSDIPREHLLSLFKTASEAVRGELRAADPRKAQLYGYMVSEATSQIETQVRENSAQYAAARAEVLALQQAGELTEARLLEFARGGKFDETTIALSLLCDLPIAHVERAIAHGHTDQTLVLARAIDLSWETTMALLMMRSADRSAAMASLERTRASFFKLQPETARSAIQFYRLRARAAMPRSN